jgi:hypothetical protein
MRKQFPLLDVCSMTVNGTQGATLFYQVIKFGEKPDFQYGQGYVQTTRNE